MSVDSHRVAGVVLAGGGSMGELMRKHDWAQSLAGPVEEWPQSLRTAVGILLASGYPMLIVWGPEFVQFYNDAFRPILGATKHPAALGQSAQECWAEIWDSIGGLFLRVLEGEEIGARDAPFVLDRNGYSEETYFDFSYSPIRDETGGIGGVFVTCMETTKRVLGERRMSTLRELGARTAELERPEEACRAAAAVLSENPADVPFALLYLVDPERQALRLAGRAGVGEEDTASPPVVGRGASCPWPLFEALDGGAPIVVDDLIERVGPALGSPWPEPPHSAIVLPVAGSRHGAATGVLVAGLSARRALDDDYQGFLELAADQVATAVARASAFQEAHDRAAALAELDRAKTEFFSNVSHEFRTPLTLLLGPLDDVLADPTLVGRARTRLELVRRNGLRLLGLVNTLLDFARLEAGRAEASYEPVDLARLTRELAAVFESVAERAGLRLVVDCAPLPEPVYVDPELWEKVVLNLVSNAFKFTFEGEIAVAVEEGEGHAVMTVRDTGSGIPPEELPRLFERFHRIRGARARTHEGAGIGLALVHELVKLHGGTIDVVSEPGDGTTFTIAVPYGTAHLPADRVTAARTPVATTTEARMLVHEAAALIDADPRETPGTAPVDPAGGRILLVDDNADMREYMSGLLAEDWTIEGVADGRVALEAARERPPDLVIADVMMPGLDGFELLAGLRADPRTAAVPVIIVSARAGEESAIEGVEAGADDYLVKPFSARELIARVRMTLELSRLRTEAGRLAALDEIRSRVITTVSHELRTPVSAIYGAAKTLDRVDTPAARQGELVRMISAESERLARITNDILTAETLASGVLSLETGPVDVGAVVDEAVGATLISAPPRTEIRPNVPPEPVLVRADRSRLLQVISNLLDNAIKYAPDADGVTVDVEIADRRVSIVVADRGIGIPPAQRERIFERFFRADPELARGIGGVGLGLFICRELTEAMGGTIWVETNEPRGSRFVVSLPRIQPE